MSEYDSNSNAGSLESLDAQQQLRAFEDAHLGEDAPRHQGEVEKGSGSLFQRLSPEKQKAHAALTKAVATEQKVADARAALAVAESEHNAAVAAAANTSVEER